MVENISQNTDHAKIYFEDDWDIGLGGGLWSTGKAMAQYFQSHRTTIRSGFKNLLVKKREKSNDSDSSSFLSAIELGSGNGFLSVSLATVVGDLLDILVVTDLQDHLPLIQRTIHKNSHITRMIDADRSVHTIETPTSCMSMNDQHCSRLVPTKVVEHQWGIFDSTTANLLTHSSSSPSSKFDFIFGTDVAYRNYLFDSLIESLKYFSHSDTVILLGITMMDTDKEFFTLLRKSGFHYDRIADHFMEPEFRGNTFGLFVIQLAT